MTDQTTHDELDRIKQLTAPEILALEKRALYAEKQNRILRSKVTAGEICDLCNWMEREDCQARRYAAEQRVAELEQQLAAARRRGMLRAADMIESTLSEVSLDSLSGCLVHKTRTAMALLIREAAGDE